MQSLRFLRKIRRMIHMVNNVGATSIVGGSRLHQDPSSFGVIPLDPSQWEDRGNLQWTSEAAGDELARERRVRILHLWMAVMRIPHQRIGPSSASRWRSKLPARPRLRPARSVGSSTAPAVSERSRPANASTPVAITVSAGLVKKRIDRLGKSAGVPPLVLPMTSGLIGSPDSVPSWATILEPGSWDGMSGIALRQLVTKQLGDDVDITMSESTHGVTEVTMEVTGEPAGDLSGLRVSVFPPTGDEQVQTIAIVPLEPAGRRVH